MWRHVIYGLCFEAAATPCRWGRPREAGVRFDEPYGNPLGAECFLPYVVSLFESCLDVTEKKI